MTAALSVDDTNRLLEEAAVDVRSALAAQDYARAAGLIRERILPLAPDHPVAWADLAYAQLHLHEHEAAYRSALQAYEYRYHQAQTDNPHLYDVLTAVCRALNRLEEMRFYGRESLRIKKRDAAANGLPARSLPDHPPPGLSGNPQANIISYSLFGNRARYCETAVINARLAQVVYPAWTCRFYVDDTVPQHVIHRLRALGAQVVEVDERQRRISGLFWRFFVADDPDVQCFIIRDADSLLSNKERAAVDAWLASGKWFHIMRDADSHTELMLAGMWGGYRGGFNGMQQAITAYTGRLPRHSRIMDQEFLRYTVWPTAAQSVWVHDNRMLEDGSHPFPDYTLTDIEKIPCFHIGMIDAGSLIAHIPANAADGTPVRWFLRDQQGRLVCSYEDTVRQGRLSLMLPSFYSRRVQTGEWRIETQTAANQAQTADSEQP